MMTIETDGYLLFEPPGGAGPAPCVVLCPGRTGDIRGLAWLAEPIAARGFRVCGMTYADDARYVIDDLPRVADAATWLTRRGLVADDWLAVAGHSRGGAAALLTAAGDGRFRAVAALSPLTDNVRYMNALRDYAPLRYALLLEGRRAAPADDPEYYRAISAVEHADALTVPVLLVHGDMDLVNPHDHSLWLHEALTSAGNQRARLEIVPRAGHYFEHQYSGYSHDRVAALVADWLAEQRGS
jgi:dipeptidyl aminopeptidase/acylaminoacyl peptidase